MHRITKLFEKINEVGFKNTVIGTGKHIWYCHLQKKYGFHQWNVSPFELRKYIQDVAAYINARKPVCVVDFGCGLGELLRNVDAKRKIGIDVVEGNIVVAKKLDRTGKIDFRVGCFDLNSDIENMDIDFLVTLNFMHGPGAEHWKPIYEEMLTKNRVKYVVVDTHPAHDTTKHHEWDKILPECYERVDLLGEYRSGVYVEIFRNVDKRHK